MAAFYDVGARALVRIPHSRPLRSGAFDELLRGGRRGEELAPVGQPVVVGTPRGDVDLDERDRGAHSRPGECGSGHSVAPKARVPFFGEPDRDTAHLRPDLGD